MAQETVKIKGIKKKRSWGELSTKEEEYLEELQLGLMRLGLSLPDEELEKELERRLQQRRLEEAQARPLR